MARSMKTMDGNNAAAYVSYAFTEVAGIYPITPSSPMADYVDQWSAQKLQTNGQHREERTFSDKKYRLLRCSLRLVQQVPYTVP